MAAPAGFVETSSGYPIIDPDTINPQADWPNGQQAQADWLDTHAIHPFGSRDELLIKRPTMPPGQSGFAFVQNTKTLWRWSGSTWALAAPWIQSGSSGFTTNTTSSTAARTAQISFPSAFTSAPVVELEGLTGATSPATTWNLWPSNITATGFQMNGLRNNDTAMTVRWIATLTP